MEITDRTVVHTNLSANGSAVSWGAILGGALGASAMALILFVLGTGLGLTSVSPWAREGIDAGTFGMVAVAWVVFTSVASSALGGYLAGRLRVKWSDVARDEVYFRDTAHGFLAWALAALLTATLLASTMASLVGVGAKAGMAVAGGAAQVASGAAGAVASGASGLASAVSENGTVEYYMDRLFRSDGDAQPAPAPAPTVAPTPPQAQGADGAAADAPAQSAAPAAPAAPAQSDAETMPELNEVIRIVSRSYSRGELAADDREYLNQLVERHTGITAQEAEARVTEAYDTLTAELRELETSAREAADQARAASAMVSLWSFIALLAGAFAGSLSATWGGRQRDL